MVQSTISKLFNSTASAGEVKNFIQFQIDAGKSVVAITQFPGERVGFYEMTLVVS